MSNAMTQARLQTASAVMPGTALDTHARSLRAAYEEVLSGRSPRAPLRPVVTRSWNRSLALGLDPDGRNERRTLADAALRRERSLLSQVIDDLRDMLTRSAEAGNYLMVVADADGVVLWREGSPRITSTADRLGFCEGALWTERAVGTNAIGTALAEESPVELFSAEHFEAHQHPWYCTAAPIHDPRTGDLIGVVDLSGPALTLHPALGPLVANAVRFAELSLWQRHQLDLARLRTETEHLTATTPGPWLIVDDDGWVAHRHGVAVHDRIEAPRAEHAVSIPGIGLALPERVGTAARGGWLIRSGSHEQRRIVIALARTDSPSPLLTVTTDDGAWSAPLAPRRATILQLLDLAGPSGLTAAELSRQLFGDTNHIVAARAEVSRLRRQIGALVATSPYRLAEGVVFERDR